MQEWKKRPREIANNYNPAFCGEIFYYVIEEYQKIKKDGMPFILLPLILPIILHEETRDKMKTSKSSFSIILHRNPELKIGFADRAKNLMEITLETYIFLLKYNVISIHEDKIFINRKIKKRIPSKLSEDIKLSINKAKILGKLFSKIIDVATLYYIWGVRP